MEAARAGVRNAALSRSHFEEALAGLRVDLGGYKVDFRKGGAQDWSSSTWSPWTDWGESSARRDGNDDSPVFSSARVPGWRSRAPTRCLPRRMPTPSARAGPASRRGPGQRTSSARPVAALVARRRSTCAGRACIRIRCCGEACPTTSFCDRWREPVGGVERHLPDAVRTRRAGRVCTCRCSCSMASTTSSSSKAKGSTGSACEPRSATDWHRAVPLPVLARCREMGDVPAGERDSVVVERREDLVEMAQFSVFGTRASLIAVDPVKAPAFDGQWMWTDAQGRTQPKVTVFDGLFKVDNPYIASLDAAYRTLALRLREGQCNQCHVPNNPDKSKRLVLLQTPAHAGAEIKRVITAVRTDKMPLDDVGIEQPLAEPARRPRCCATARHSTNCMTWRSTGRPPRAATTSLRKVRRGPPPGRVTQHRETGSNDVTYREYGGHGAARRSGSGGRVHVRAIAFVGAGRARKGHPGTTVRLLLDGPGDGAASVRRSRVTWRSTGRRSKPAPRRWM